MLLASVYLRNKCANLGASDFDKFLNDLSVSKLNTVYSTKAAQLVTSEADSVFAAERVLTKLS